MNRRHLAFAIISLIIGFTLTACGDSPAATVEPTGTAIRPTIALPSLDCHTHGGGRRSPDL